MIDFYCGVSERVWHRHPVNPGPLACISPVYGTGKKKFKNSVKVPDHTLVRVDSGAFNDSPQERLSFSEALDRQLEHANYYGYKVERVGSYDLLIDEKWVNGKRHKRRWSESEAWWAVRETVKAAEFLAKNYQGGRVLSAQGVTANQYLECTKRVLGWFNPNQDVFGLGGWCISGKMPVRMRPTYNETMLSIFPVLAKHGVKEVHIWGVTDVTFLGPLLWICDQHDIKLATDSSGPKIRPVMGGWGFRGWVKRDYKKPPKEQLGVHQAIHVQLMRSWLNSLRNTRFYHHPDHPDSKDAQKSLWDNHYY